MVLCTKADGQSFSTVREQNRVVPALILYTVSGRAASRQLVAISSKSSLVWLVEGWVQWRLARWISCMMLGERNHHFGGLDYNVLPLYTQRCPH